MANQSTLQNIYSRSFPSNHLMEISLVKDMSQDLAFYKPKTFCFLSLTPGVKDNNTHSRSFQKEGKITLKVDCEKVLGLAYSLRAFARGQGEQFGQFTVFVDGTKSTHNNNGGQIKTCFVSEYNQAGQNNTTKKLIVLSFKIGTNSKPLGVYWTIPETFAIADIFEWVSKKGFEIDFDSKNQVVGTMRPTGGQPDQFIPPQQQFNQGPPPQQFNQGPPQQNFNQGPPQQQFNQGPPQQNIVEQLGNSMMNLANIDEDIPF